MDSILCHLMLHRNISVRLLRFVSRENKSQNLLSKINKQKDEESMGFSYLPYRRNVSSLEPIVYSQHIESYPFESKPKHSILQIQILLFSTC